LESQNQRDSAIAGSLGPNYCCSFMRCHTMLRQKKHANCDQKKDDFVKPEFFQGMYYYIYTNHVGTGIYIQHKEARYCDLRGNVVDNDDSADVGFPTK
jgi:hypothetical protein